MAGLLSVFAGISLTAVTTSGDDSSAQSYTLLSITAVIMGGSAFAGGIVVPQGIAAAAITLSFVGLLLSILNIDPNLTSAAVGIILVLVLAGRGLGQKAQNEMKLDRLPTWTWSVAGALLAWFTIGAVTQRFTLETLAVNATTASFLVVIAFGRLLVVSGGDGGIDLSIPYTITLGAYITAATMPAKMRICPVGVGDSGRTGSLRRMAQCMSRCAAQDACNRGNIGGGFVGAAR